MKLWMLIIPFLFMMSCKDDAETPANDSFAIMTDYMVDQSMDLPDVLDGWITARPATVEDLPTFLENRYVMDLRSAADFSAGHIEGAVNTTLGTLLADAQNAGGKQILLVCYTGQTAGHANVALRLSGYTNSQVLKWGMSGWAEAFSGPWNNNLSSGAVGSPNWKNDGETAALQTFQAPTFESTSTAGADILAERVAFMLTKGFSGVPSADVYGDPSLFLINNYWAQADVDHYGHINTAYRIQPLTIANGEILNYDPQADVVTYCWTGQTSSMVTAYLTVLGYNAKSLKFGTNSMIYSELESHKFSTPTVDYPVVTD